MQIPKPVLDHHLKQFQPLMEKWNESSQVPPVLLFTGIAGIGKKEMGLYLSKWLLCENQCEEDSLSFFSDQTTPKEKSNEPCEKCANCHRFDSGSHIDFKIIASDPDKNSIRIEQFRELISKQGFGASQGSYKITLIDQAEQMTPQAANSLLKILEEPPKGWIFILTAANEKLLLPTLVSRCQKLRLKPLQKGEILSILKEGNLNADQTQMIAETACGSWKKAVSMTESPFWNKRKQIYDFLISPQEHLSKLVDWASQNNDNIEFICEQFEWMINDLIKKQQSSQPYQWMNADQKAVLNRLTSAQLTPDFLLKQMSLISSVRKKTSAPLNKKLMVQDLLMPWLQ